MYGPQKNQGWTLVDKDNTRGSKQGENSRTLSEAEQAAINSAEIKGGDKNLGDARLGGRLG